MEFKLPRLKIFSYWWGKPLLILMLALTLEGIFLNFRLASAGISGVVYNILAYVFQGIANFAGNILMFLVNILIIVCGYNNFINAPIVRTGWALVRDVANMFYILIMLVIAFATMLKIEKYSLKALLPRLIITAILVNFSKTIIGVIIDFGQVIMLTFVNGFAATAGGNFVSMFGIADLFKIARATEDADTRDAGAALSYLLAAVAMGIAATVVGIFVLILLFRIITLWILIILSPLAFLLGTFPKGQVHYSKWWDKLINNIIVGPIVAFFLWLSLSVAGGGNQMAELKDPDNQAISQEIIGVESSEQKDSQMVGLTQFGTWENLGSFVVSIALLLTCLTQIQELGGISAGLASGAMGKMKSLAKTAVKRAAIPGALLAGGTALGLGIPGALLMRGGLKGTMDVMARMPVIGKLTQKLRKGAEQYGLGESGKMVRGAHKGIMGQVEKMPLIGGAAARMKAEVVAKERAEGREGAKNVRELSPEEVIREAQRGKTLTAQGSQMKFEAQARVLGDPELRKKLSEPDLEKMVGGFKKIGDQTGNSDRANSILKEFKKNNPHRIAEVDPKTGAIDAAKTAEAKRKAVESATPRQMGEDWSPDAFKDDDVFNSIDHERLGGQILQQGNETNRRAYSRALLNKRFGVSEANLDAAEAAAQPGGAALSATAATDIQTQVGGRLAEMPDGSLSRPVFKALTPDQQIEALKLKKITIAKIEAGDLTADNGRLAGAVANAESTELRDSVVRSPLRGDLETGLRSFIAGIASSAPPSINPADLRIAVRAAEIKAKRLAGDSSVIPGVVVDQMLGNNGIAPRTPAADAFMDNWDREEAGKQLEQERITTERSRADAVLRGMGRNESEVYDRLEYNPTAVAPDGTQGTWTGATAGAKKEQEATVARAAQTDEIAAALKGLKVEAVIKKDPLTGVVQGLTNLGRVLTENIRVSTLIKMAQEATTRTQRDMIAALVAAKKARGTKAEQEQLDKKLKAPAFQAIDWEPLVSDIRRKIKK